jgi:hypothetical protein
MTGRIIGRMQGRIRKKGAISLRDPVKTRRLGWITVVVTLVLSVVFAVVWYLIG